MTARHIFPSEVPPNLPEGWREAANWHIDWTDNQGMIARLKRVVADARMLPFWRAVDSLNGVISQQRMLALLVAGAYAPAENPGEIMSRRRKIATKARELAELIAGDADARHIDVEELLHWTCPPELPRPPVSNRRLRMRMFIDGDSKWTTRRALITREARRHHLPPRLSMTLEVLAQKLESNQPLHGLDPIQRVPWAASREIDASTRLVRTLAAETGIFRDVIGFDLIALAANVATGASIDASKARAIWRVFLRSNPS